MSRAYRIRVSESLARVIRASDHVSTHLELLALLPPEEMAELLARELERLGFEREGETLVRRDGGLTLTVELPSAKVTVRSESEAAVELKEEREGRGFDDVGPSREAVQQRLREEAKSKLEQGAAAEQAKLQQQVTDELERRLGDLRAELDQAANRATAEALKAKAARMGQIKEMTEDPEGGLTIVVEV